MVAVPPVIVSRLLLVRALLALMLSEPPATVTVPLLVPNAVAVFAFMVPALMVVVPFDRVLVPVRVTVPAPSLVNDPLEPLVAPRITSAVVALITPATAANAVVPGITSV